MNNTPPKNSDAATWDFLTRRVLKNWVATFTSSRLLRQNLLTKARGISPSWNWIERAYWAQQGKPPVSQHYSDVLNPIEARALSLHSLTLCAMLQPGIVAHT